jgi:glycine oxidase
VDNVRLTDALTAIVARHPSVRVLDDAAVMVDLDSAIPAVVAGSAGRVSARRIVLAAGAWTGTIQGLPRPVPVRPVRGQICTIQTAPLRHVVLSSDGYMVTRGVDRTLVGSTMEEVGFDAGTTQIAIDRLRQAAAAVCAALDGRPVLEAWSGLRPATPDLLPILGPDPDCRALIYACGHSRNGILLAPITASAVSAIAADEAPPWDLTPFSIERFASLAAIA